ncbi:MAG: hypothetical protein JJT78_09530 [Leptospira sp.]|nr:hypothetical protein [Leptospira sp.]
MDENSQKYIDYQHPTSRDQWRFYLVTVLITGVIVAGYFLGLPPYYLGWIAFATATFSVAGNDAVQTVGTFIESKKSVHWIPKIALLGGLLVVVHIYGWIKDDGEIHFHRLDRFPETTEFNLIQLLAPVILVIITRMRAPVSTTFLVLGLFGGQNIDKMLTKSFLGYGLAFFSAIVIWAILAKVDPHEYTEEHIPNPVSERRWSTLQWFSTIFLWVAWLFQDTANIAVYLPRQLNWIELCIALGILVLSIGAILKTNGGTIQEVVSEKSDIKWAKAATIVDLIYGSILVIFQMISNLPMSTTWVFLGLLAGREIILNVVTYRDLPYLDTFRKVGKDVILASLGIAVSIAIYILSTMVYPENNSFKFEFFKPGVKTPLSYQN